MKETLVEDVGFDSSTQTTDPDTGLCTAIVRSTVTNVTMALDAGMSVAERRASY